MLTRQFIENLATKAHQLKPVVITGDKGLTASVHQEIDVQLTAHELIKIRLNAETREDRQAMITEIAEKHQATVVKQIGHILVLYRQREE